MVLQWRAALAAVLSFVVVVVGSTLVVERSSILSGGSGGAAAGGCARYRAPRLWALLRRHALILTWRSS